MQRLTATKEKSMSENTKPIKPHITLDIPAGVEVSDGYHTFTELYEHRCTLWITLCRALKLLNVNRSSRPEPVVWRSRAHSDGSQMVGWFVLGFGQLQGEQITYHLPEVRWEETSWAQTWDKAPEYDRHTSDDVLERLKSLKMEV